MRVLLESNWTDSKHLCNLWSKMGDGDYKFTRDGKTVEIVWEKPYDYVFIVNQSSKSYQWNKTIYSIMEPIFPNIFWETMVTKPNLFKAIWNHSNTSWNNQEWHLNKTRQWLLETTLPEKTNEISSVLSNKYIDPGHIKRIDFAKLLQNDLHVFGNDGNWTNYKGSLPPWCKDDAIFPYKYTFNVENHSIPGYITEKLIDGILGECLTFYSGPDNVGDFIDTRAFVQLDLDDKQESLRIVKNAMSENLWEDRLPYIQEAKQKILNETSFFPRLWSEIFA